MFLFLFEFISLVNAANADRCDVKELVYTLFRKILKLVRNYFIILARQYRFAIATI